MMDWHSIYIVDKKIFLFENVAFSQFLTLEIADSEKLRHNVNPATETDKFCLQ